MAPRHDLNGLRVQQYGDCGGGQIKRWITSAATMDRFQFDWGKIKRWDVPLAKLGLPDGPDISWP
jgi:hypothetical protein